MRKTRRFDWIRRYETSAEVWIYEANNYSGKAADNVRNYARHLQTLAECLKLNLLKDKMPPPGKLI